MLFEEHHYGKRISEKLSEYLKEFTDVNDRADVAEKMEVSSSIIRDVVYRTRTITANNKDAIVELMRVAIKNCMSRMASAKTAKTFLESQLPVEVE